MKFKCILLLKTLGCVVVRSGDGTAALPQNYNFKILRRIKEEREREGGERIAARRERELRSFTLLLRLRLF